MARKCEYRDWRFFLVSRSWRMWGLGWYAYRLTTYPHYRVLVIAFGPLRFHFKDMASRWKDLGDGA